MVYVPTITDMALNDHKITFLTHTVNAVSKNTNPTHQSVLYAKDIFVVFLQGNAC